MDYRNKPGARIQVDRTDDPIRITSGETRYDRERGRFVPTRKTSISSIPGDILMSQWRRGQERRDAQRVERGNQTPPRRAIVRHLTKRAR